MPPRLVWLFTLPTIAILLNVIVLLWIVPVAFRTRLITRGMAMLLVVLLAIFPLSIYWHLLHPLPLPNIAMPEPNGIADVAAAARVFQRSPILNTDVEPKSTNELAAEIDKHAAEFKQLRRGLSRPIQLRSWPHDELMTSFDMTMDSVMLMRSAARGLMRDAELAQQQGRYKDAAEISLETIHFGQAIARNGLLIDFWVGIAIEGIGDDCMYKSLPGLNADECREFASRLAQTEQTRERSDDVIHRDRIWSQHAYGWWGHLIILLEDAPRFDSRDATQQSLVRKNTITRLMIAELAARAYQMNLGSLPEGLQSLVPEYLPEVPVDPFDPNSGTIRYITRGDGFVVYSVGYDGRDNGGVPPPLENQTMWDETVPADLRLDSFLAPYEESNDAAADAPDADSSEETDIDPTSGEPAEIETAP